MAHLMTIEEINELIEGLIDRAIEWSVHGGIDRCLSEIEYKIIEQHKAELLKAIQKYKEQK